MIYKFWKKIKARHLKKERVVLSGYVSAQSLGEATDLANIEITAMLPYSGPATLHEIKAMTEQEVVGELDNAITASRL